MKKTGRSVAGREWRMNPYTLGFGLDVRLFSVCAHLRRDLNPSCKGFSIGRTVRDSKEPEWAADKKTHGARSHGAYPSRRVRERPRKIDGSMVRQADYRELSAFGCCRNLRNHWETGRSDMGYHLWGTYVYKKRYIFTAN